VGKFERAATVADSLLKLLHFREVSVFGRQRLSGLIL
jgi:hypothetical protein